MRRTRRVHRFFGESIAMLRTRQVLAHSFNSTRFNKENTNKRISHRVTQSPIFAQKINPISGEIINSPRYFLSALRPSFRSMLYKKAEITRNKLRYVRHAIRRSSIVNISVTPRLSKRTKELVTQFPGISPVSL